MKLAMILNSIILWISVWSQPIVGYNYWAKLYHRVRETLNLVLIVCSIVWITAFILFQTIPGLIIWIFGAWDVLYIEFAILAFKIYLFFCFCYWIQIPAGIFFQSIWKSRISALLSLSRQIIILIPAFFILWHFFGIMWILYAGAVADFVSVLLALGFLMKENKSLCKKHNKEENIKEKSLKSTNISKELYEIVAERSLISN